MQGSRTLARLACRKREKVMVTILQPEELFLDSGWMKPCGGRHHVECLRHNALSVI